MSSSRKSPGPGAYDPKSEVEKGRYSLSAFKNAGITTFSPLSSPRFPKIKKIDCLVVALTIIVKISWSLGIICRNFSLQGTELSRSLIEIRLQPQGFGTLQGLGAIGFQVNLGIWKQNKALDKRQNTQSMPNLKSQGHLHRVRSQSLLQGIK
ncbi:unnamed protein product [Blepharisma stoltei]|uniref:Uncharacterized protein n=1 Tax=Blepharisma stoltei TaxID=1481888 RepID=A0AAU9JCI5_9CILI|nr:unnamed protein product [Blepharisma stoltei]